MYTRIGVDVGGTNTDAVLMAGGTLLSKAKRPTTPDVTTGVLAAVEEVLYSRPEDAHIRGVMLGTTHFTNALLERKRLTPTAVLRLCLPATRLLPPLVDWPQPLRDAIGGFTYMVHGGHEFDGREIAPLDPTEIRAAVEDMRGKGVRALAVCGVFSPTNPAHEEQAAAIVRREAPEFAVTVSHQIGRIGLLERENAATLNACLTETAQRTIGSLQEALGSLDLDVPLYLSQNDGTLMDSAYAVRYPVFTIASGPTNSMKGAAFLSGVLDGIVVDVGGTSTDGGALVAGFPREASVAVSIAGVRTNFRMPDVVSIALGGGSLIRQDPLRIGPHSVGHRLAEEGLVFGGSSMTVTDLAVAGGLAEIGDPRGVGDLDDEFVGRALGEVRNRLESLVDQLKLSAAPVPVVLVGGGNVVVGDSMDGAAQVLRPPHAEVANAIGAAIAQVGAYVEKVFSLEQVGREGRVGGRARRGDGQGCGGRRRPGYGGAGGGGRGTSDLSAQQRRTDTGQGGGRPRGSAAGWTSRPL